MRCLSSPRPCAPVALAAPRAAPSQPPSQAAAPCARSRAGRFRLCSRRREGAESVHPFSAEGSAFAPSAEASPGELSALLQLLRQRQQGNHTPPPGRVHLVGTGPGSPELLTLQALRLMQTADVVLYDRLVSPEILELVHPGARMVYVGKAAGFHTRTQEEIHALLQEFASAGAVVVRLKGGDPLIFGRGGEECDYLRDRGVVVDVSPGITAASGIAAELGVPLTHRGVAASVRFLTGHSREGGEEASEVDDTSFSAADANCTLVVYMGLGTLSSLTAALLGAGLSPRTPALAVERGTTAVQRRVFSRLAGLADATRATALRSPTLVVVGQCVALSPLWPWSEEAQGEDRAFVLQTGSPHAQQQEAQRVTLPGGKQITLPRAALALRAEAPAAAQLTLMRDDARV